MIDFNDETGSAVGIYFVVMGSAFLVATIIASVFFEVSFSTPIFFIIIGVCIVLIFGGLKKKKKSNDRINKITDPRGKSEIGNSNLRSKMSKETEEDLLEKEIMKIFDIDKYK